MAKTTNEIFSEAMQRQLERSKKATERCRDEAPYPTRFRFPWRMAAVRAKRAAIIYAETGTYHA